MDFALSTNWNSHRHASGEAMVDEILSLGFSGVEVGYNFSAGLVPGLLNRIRSGAVSAASVHAYAPVPLEAPGGHPELFLLAAIDEDVRGLALFHMRTTLNFAQTIGARVVLAHAGRVPVGGCWERHARSHATGSTDHWRYRWNLRRLLRLRRRRIERHLDALRRSLDALMPQIVQAGLVLALENLPSWDALPSADEMLQLAADYGKPLRCWHDIGHGQVMENCGFGPHVETARRLRSVLAGAHIHDVGGVMQDHLAPGCGRLDFSCFGFLADHNIIRVFEPAPAVAPEKLIAGLALMNRTWSTDKPQANGDGLA